MSNRRLSSTRTTLVPPSKKQKVASSPPPVEPEAESENFAYLYDFEVWPPMQRGTDNLITTLAECLTKPPFLKYPQAYGELPKDAGKIAREIVQEALMLAEAAASSCGLSPSQTFSRYNREISKRLTGAPADPAAESSDSELD